MADTVHDVISEMRRLSDQLDAALAFLREKIEATATAENVYRQAVGHEWVKVLAADEGTAAFKDAQVKAATADKRMARDIADGMRHAAIEAVRSRRTQISALQSVANAMKAEAEFSRTGPEVRR